MVPGASFVRFRLRTLLLFVLLAALLLWLLEVAPFLHDNLVVRFERIGVAPTTIDDAMEVVRDEALLFYRQHKLLPWKRTVHTIVLIPHQSLVRPRPTSFFVRRKLESKFELISGEFLRFTRQRAYPYLGTKTADMLVARPLAGQLYECCPQAAKRWVEGEVNGKAILNKTDLNAAVIHTSYAEIERFFMSSPTVPWTATAVLDATSD